MNMENVSRTKDFFEKILVALVLFAVFLPIRLVFFTYVSQYWLGSVGLISGVLLVLVYLARKGKLGYFGRIMNKQILRFSRGRYGKGVVISIVFFVYLYSNILYGTENPTDSIREKFEEEFRQAGVTDLETLQEQSENLVWTGPGAAWGILFSLALIIIPNSLGHTMFYVFNNLSNGWVQHFVIVILVQELEGLGLIVYFRYFYKSN